MMPKDLVVRPIIASAELEAMTPAERKAAFDANVVVTDLAPTSGGLPRGPAADGAELRPYVIFERPGVSWDRPWDTKRVLAGR